MKQGLSLRVSQHLALTPQLQQSIRLLQLSTLELGQEIQQMLDDNPFLEVHPDDPSADAFVPAVPEVQANGQAAEGEEGHDYQSAADTTRQTEASNDSGGEGAELGGESAEPSWEGDGTTETVADDGEWGADGSTT